MLCQLVCTDRRYARMNCFNIRELQGILKRKFFVDLVNSHDHRHLFKQTMIGLRYKLNMDTNLNTDIHNFFNLGLHNTNLPRSFSFNNAELVSTLKTNNYRNFFLNFINYRELNSEILQIFYYYKIFLGDIFYNIYNFFFF
jgi:hypothetical protein